MPQVAAGALSIGYAEHGPADGPPVVLMHGFPDDIRVWDAVAPALGRAGCRVLTPYMRGYGPTRFLDAATPRSGEQAAFGADLLALLDALGIGRAVLAGYDWGGRAACVVAALWPERVRALVSVGGYNIQDIARAAAHPGPVETELRYWYQWYLNTERGRLGLTRNRRDLCRKMWQLWSPNWPFDEAVFAATAASWDNEDFVAVSVHSYRHRYAVVPGDPAYADIERRLAAQPMIGVPTIALDGAADDVTPPHDDAAHFSGPYEYRLIPIAGHFLPRDDPRAFLAALTTLLETTER